MNSSEDIISHGNMPSSMDKVGRKAKNLKKYYEAGFNVPAFIALPSNLSQKMLQNQIFRQEIVAKTAKELKAKRYIVRSSAFIEDGNGSSYAGQFLSIGDLDKDGLDKAINDVLAHADNYLKGNLEGFSLIIQEYIEPDISGVAFTRSPSGGREMVIEYGYCKGDDIVGGNSIPTQYSFYWNQKHIPLRDINKRIIDIFKEIEKVEGFPQDIEWCIKDDTFYLLQVRPITTIDSITYEQMLFLDSFMPTNEDFYYAKEGICESIPRPNNMTFSILQKIYANNGPVHSVYQKYGIAYEDTGFLKIIGNELFYDKEKELISLLPGYSCLNKCYEPKFSRLKGLITTVKNIYRLNTISTDYDEIFHLLRDKLILQYEERGVKHAIEIFLENYKIVFEINLLFGFAQKRLSSLLEKESLGYSSIISNGSYFTNLSSYEIIPPDNLTGNHLDLSDESDFVASTPRASDYNPELIKWWDNLESTKKSILKPVMDKCIILEYLREVSRWLAIRDMNCIKKELLFCAMKNNFNNPQNIYFSSIEEVIRGSFDESSCINNMERYMGFNHWRLPTFVSSSYINKVKTLQAVSAGTAKGILCNIDSLPKDKEGYILYSDCLSPDLVKYFDRVEGILANRGGVLSHLAIMAREKGVPVISGFHVGDGGVELGDNITMNGDSGLITKDY